MKTNSSINFLILFSVAFATILQCTTASDEFNFLQQKSFKNRNFQPIIGVISQAVKGEPLSEIEVSYVKFIEMGGGRAAPIRLDANFTEIEYIFKHINGLLFPGGDTPLLQHGKFFEIEAFLFKLAIEANDKGDFFPIWGTCLGFEAMAQIVTGNTSFIHPLNFDDINVVHKLKWNPNTDVIRSSKLLNLCNAKQSFANKKEEAILSSEEETMSSFEKEIIYKRPVFRREMEEIDPVLVSEQFESSNEDNFMCNLKVFEAAEIVPLAAYWHEDGVTMDEWRQQSPLNDFFHLLASSVSTKGVEFIAMVEAKRYPIYGVQFHPEKNLFAFSPFINATHGLIASQFTQYFSVFFIDEARKNFHRFPDYETEFKYLIYKHAPTIKLHSKHQYDFSQVYRFPYNGK